MLLNSLRIPDIALKKMCARSHEWYIVEHTRPVRDRISRDTVGIPVQLNSCSAGIRSHPKRDASPWGY